MNGKHIILQLSNIFALKNCALFLITGNFMIILLNAVVPHYLFLCSKDWRTFFYFKMSVIAWTGHKIYEIIQIVNCAWKDSNS